MSLDLCYPDTTNWNGYDLPTTPTDPQQLQIDLAEALGWEAIKTLTGGRLSTCAITVRPCKKDRRFGTYYIAPVGWFGGAFQPHIAVDGEWVNCWCGDEGDCSCEGVDVVRLPGPIGRITEVQIDGVTVDPAAYRVDDGDKLIRQDGSAWPLRQNMDLPAGEVGTWSVTYFQGATIDDLFDYAAGQLAIEFYKAITGAKGCRLPKNVQAVTRQGVTFEMSVTMFENGKTGIQEVDAIIARVNPFLLKVGPQIASFDTLRRSHRTTFGG